jgi:DNA-binding LytR/AlgR family response regulator
MILDIAICDDEKIILDELYFLVTTLFADTGMEYRITTYGDGSELLSDCSNKSFDIMFLDIEMPKVTGLQVAETMRNNNPYVNIIFITNRDDLVFHSIRFKPFRFIRKHYIKEELPEAVQALVRKIRSENQYYTISFNNSTIEIKIKDILYVESYKHDIYLYSKEEKYRIKSNLKTIEKEFEPFGFIRVHSGYLVNYRFIYSIDKTKVILTNTDMVPLSRYRIEAVKQKLMLYSRGT